MISTSIHLKDDNFAVLRGSDGDNTNWVRIQQSENRSYPSLVIFVDSPERAKLIEVALVTPILEGTNEEKTDRRGN